MTAKEPTPTNSGWIVTAHQEQTQMGAAGTFVPGVVVYFTTGQGHQGSVFLENAQFNPESVKQKINLRADLLDAVGTLTSDS